MQTVAYIMTVYICPTLIATSHLFVKASKMNGLVTGFLRVSTSIDQVLHMWRRHSHARGKGAVDLLEGMNYLKLDLLCIAMLQSVDLQFPSVACAAQPIRTETDTFLTSSHRLHKTMFLSCHHYACITHEMAA